MVPPAAPQALEYPSPVWFFNTSVFNASLKRKLPAATLTMAFTICSKTWEKAVGTMVPCPWKYPRNTPRYAMIHTVGANVLSANAA